LSREIDKQNVLCPHNAVLVSNKKKWIINRHSTMNESYVHFAKWKKLRPKGALTV
jgi:hypothetical protein